MYCTVYYGMGVGLGGCACRSMFRWVVVFWVVYWVFSLCHTLNLSYQVQLF